MRMRTMPAVQNKQEQDVVKSYTARGIKFAPKYIRNAYVQGRRINGFRERVEWKYAVGRES